MRVTASMVVNRPVEEVFALVSDVETLTAWTQGEREEQTPYRVFFKPMVITSRNAQVRATRQTSEGPLGVGTTFVQDAEIAPGLSFEITVEVIVYEPHRAVTFQFRGQPISTYERRFVLESLAGSTRVTYTATREAGLLYKLVTVFFAPEEQKIMETQLSRLKERLEAQPEAGL